MNITVTLSLSRRAWDIISRHDRPLASKARFAAQGAIFRDRTVTLVRLPADVADQLRGILPDQIRNETQLTISE